MNETPNRFPYFQLFQAAWRYLGSYRRYYVLAICGLMMSQLVSLATPYIFGKLIDHIQDGIDTHTDLFRSLTLALIYFLLTPLFWAFHAPSRIIERQSGFLVHKQYLDETYAKVRQLPYSWHQNLHSGQLVDRIKKSAQALEDFTSNQFVYLNFLIDLIGPLAIILYYFPWAGLGCVILSVGAAFAIARFDRKLVPLYTEKNRLAHEEVGVFTDYLSNIRTIITLRLGQATQSELMQRFMAKKVPQWREIRLNEFKWAAISHAANFFVTSLIVVIVLVMYRGSPLQIGSIVMLIQYLTRFSGVFANMGNTYQQMVQQATNYLSAAPIESEFRDHEKKMQAQQGTSDSVDWNEIRISNLRFSYKDKMNRAHALRDINFTLHRGEKIALIGPSGSGKSTLMTLLRGLYDAEEVMLEIGEKVYDTLLPFRQMTALIPQDPEIFENTIRYNITFGVDQKEDAIKRACEIACFDTVLENLPKGMESDMREKGVNLSGGQKQRLALARGVFSIQENSLILLDEPTSSIDTKTEGHIFDNMFRAFPDKTMMASVHRLHLLPLFDRVFVLRDGEIVEQGQFAELIKHDGLLREMWLNYQDAARKGMVTNEAPPIASPAAQNLSESVSVA